LRKLSDRDMALRIIRQITKQACGSLKVDHPVPLVGTWIPMEMPVPTRTLFAGTMVQESYQHPQTSIAQIGTKKGQDRK